MKFTLLELEALQVKLKSVRLKVTITFKRSCIIERKDWKEILEAMNPWTINKIYFTVRQLSFLRSNIFLQFLRKNQGPK